MTDEKREVALRLAQEAEARNGVADTALVLARAALYFQFLSGQSEIAYDSEGRPYEAWKTRQHWVAPAKLNPMTGECGR